jgi:hypothetical protein
MPVKDGQLAPSLFRDMTNGSVIVGMFLRSKIRDLTAISSFGTARPDRGFPIPQHDGTVGGIPAIAAVVEFRNQTL